MHNAVSTPIQSRMPRGQAIGVSRGRTGAEGTPPGGQAPAPATAGADGIVVLTGADPAFCAGVDLKQFGSEEAWTGGTTLPDTPTEHPWTPIDKPVIGAINGATVTGGLELALACDILIASDRAVFADTHARVGLMPMWGLTARLPEALGEPLRKMPETLAFLAPLYLNAGTLVAPVAAASAPAAETVRPAPAIAPQEPRAATDAVSAAGRANDVA